MRLRTACTLGLGLFLSTNLPAEVNIICLDAPPQAAVATAVTAKASDFRQKVDRGTAFLLLPYFEVDTNDVAGSTTLFAVRNITDSPVSVRTTYFTLDGFQQGLSTLVILDPKETRTINVRGDSAAFAVDPDGFARGFASIDDDNVSVGDVLGVNADKGITLPPAPGTIETLAGDYFQVISDQDFASGDRLLNIDPLDNPYSDLCAEAESRFLNGGPFTGGSAFTFFTQPGGTAVNAPPTLTATIYDEAGGEQEFCQVFTDQFSLRIPASDLTSVAFGTAEFAFGETGAVVTEFNALGRFSVGVRGLCKDAPILVSP